MSLDGLFYTHRILYHVDMSDGAHGTLKIKFHGNEEDWAYFIPFFDQVRFELNADPSRASQGGARAWKKDINGAHTLPLDSPSLVHRPVSPEQALKAVTNAIVYINAQGAKVEGQNGGVVLAPSEEYEKGYVAGYDAGYAAAVKKIREALNA